MQQPDNTLEPTMLQIEDEHGQTREEEAFTLQKAARYLGVTYPTLMKRLQQFGITQYQNELRYGRARYVLVKDLDRLKRSAVRPVDDH